jgi:phage terminase Nu1 subunit (DNA packaging protein)
MKLNVKPKSTNKPDTDPAPAPTEKAALINPDKCTMFQAAKIFRVNDTTVRRWIQRGAPQNEDGTISLSDVFDWKLAEKQERTGRPTQDLQKEELKQKVMKLQIANEKSKENMIDRSMHEQILSSRATSLRRFLENTLSMNLPRLAGRTVDELRTEAFQLSTEMMDAWVGHK